MSVFFMAYAITHTTESGVATVSQRTPEGWIFLAHRHRSVAGRWVNEMNEELRRTYMDNGYNLKYPKEVE